ncbi:MAG TPA: hypothetical protein VM657_11080 [Sphingomonas sp.]|nr:hypothetical protein [Sphingomonas sp.]
MSIRHASEGWHPSLPISGAKAQSEVPYACPMTGPTVKDMDPSLRWGDGYVHG